MIKKIVLLLLVIISCASLTSEEKSYTPAQKQFVCEFWEEFILMMNLLDNPTGKTKLRPGEKLIYPENIVKLSIVTKEETFKAILAWGNKQVRSKNCPNDVRQAWGIYSNHVISALKTGFDCILKGRSMTSQQKKYIDDVNFVYKYLCRSYRYSKGL